MKLNRFLDSCYKTIFYSVSCIALIVSAMSGCGGGGGSAGGTGGGSQNDAEVPLRFTPNTIVASWDEGDSASLEVVAHANHSYFDDYEFVLVRVIDEHGILSADIELWYEGQDTFIVTLATNPNLVSGEYTGNFEIQICEDAVCFSPLPASPIYLPYEFTVESSAKITPLVRWPNAGEWTTYQADAGHTGYVPVTLNSVDFSPRWTWKPQTEGLTIVPVVTREALVYVGTFGHPWEPTTLHALNEFDGSVQWQYDFNEYQINPPAVADNKIFVATVGSIDSMVKTHMWSFDASTGTQLSKVLAVSDSVNGFAPTPYGNAVYALEGRSSGLSCYSADQGADLWSVNLQMSYDLWTPAVDDQYIYVYANGAVVILNKDSSEHASIDDPEHDWNGWSLEIAPVIPEQGKVLTVNGIDLVKNFDTRTNELIQFDINGLSIDWSKKGRFVTNPAVANQVIYVANASPFQLEARSVSDGAILWTWSPDDPKVKGFTGNLIVTDNTVLLSTENKVHAIDITTKKSVWSHWAAGELALSPNGVLYIVGRGTNEGMLYAVNLK